MFIEKHRFIIELGDILVCTINYQTHPARISYKSSGFLSQFRKHAVRMRNICCSAGLKSGGYRTESSKLFKKGSPSAVDRAAHRIRHVCSQKKVWKVCFIERIRLHENSKNRKLSLLTLTNDYLTVL